MQLGLGFRGKLGLKILNSCELNLIGNGLILATLFFQPSTRTRLGFQTAAIHLGMQNIGFSDIQQSRCVEYCNESIEDCVRVVNQMANCIIFRHHFTKSGIDVARISSIPIVNAGDGFNEHPVQAINDAYVIYKTLGTLDHLSFGLVGDPNGRVLRSLIITISKFNSNKIIFLLPPGITLPQDIQQVLKSTETKYTFCTDINELLLTADIIEILPVVVADIKVSNKDLINKLTPDNYVITKRKIQDTNSKSLILHPGPRSDELHSDTDLVKNSLYFQQVKESIYVKMGILKNLLRK